MPDPLWSAENDGLAVTIYTNATAAILDRVTGAHWRMGPVALQEDDPIDTGHVWVRTERSQCEQYPGRFSGRREGNHLRFTLLGREGRAVGRFACRPRLDGPWFELRLEEVDERLPGLTFPPPIESESLILPIGVGRWLRRPLPGRRFWVYPTHLNMRWFGGLRGDSGWLAVLHEGYANAGVLATGLSVSPAWLRSLDGWPGVRTVRYRFLGGGYVGLAKAFRAYAQARGLHRPLAEKMAEVPAVANLHGGRLLSYMQAQTLRPERYEDRLLPVPPDVPPAGGNPVVLVSHSDARAMIRDAQSLGMERGLVVLRGWVNGGYDERHPDIWPPEAALGPLVALKGLLALGNPLTVALHDNYQDVYEQSPSWPRGVVRLPQGYPLPGGYWAGGQAYILSSRASLAYARRNWTQIATLAPRAMFIDTVTAARFYESYEAGGRQSRSQDEALKVELLRFYKQQGLALGSEEGADFGVPWLDWLENRHRRVAGESIPLWPLVFHDAAFCARYERIPEGEEAPHALATRLLTDMLWGYMVLWSVRDRAHWRATREAFAGSLYADAWHRRVGAAEMLSHRYLSEDGEVEETVFGPGVALLANFSPEPRTMEGVTVPACGYVVQD